MTWTAFAILAMFYYREFNGIPQNSYGYAGFLQNISNRFAADFTKLNREGIKASFFAPKTFLKSEKTFSKALRSTDPRLRGQCLDSITAYR